MALRKRKVALTGIAGAVAGLLIAGAAIAASGANSPTPANKAIAAGDKTAVFQQGDTQLLSATLRTSKPTDLMIQTTLECSILTKLNTAANPNAGATDTQAASGQLRGWIEVDDDSQAREVPEVGQPYRIVPIESVSNPPQNGSTPNSGGVDPTDQRTNDENDDAVTYCNRTYQRTVEDGEDAQDGIDRETDYIDTKSTHAFNWVLLNAGSGIHTVRLMGDLRYTPTSTEACTRGTVDPADQVTCAEAYVGNRTMIVEPTKMANDAIISPTAQS
jgi:hypothetical protein